MAPEILAPVDDYFILFEEAMGGHMPEEVTPQYYESQCIKDDTARTNGPQMVAYPRCVWRRNVL